MKKILLPILTASVFFMQACGNDSSTSVEDEGPSSSSATETDIYTFATDFTAGELRWVIDGELSKEKLEFHQDSKVIAAGKNLFILERYGADNVSLLDTEKKKVKWQVSMDDASNPSDIVMANEKEAWVALEGSEKFVKISVEDGSVKKTVKTDAFTSKDGISPGLIDMEIRNDTLFTLFQRYSFDSKTNNTYLPSPGLLALYNSDSGKLLDTIRLATKNPTAMKFSNGNLYVATMGEYNDFWGTDADEKRGIEKVDLKKKTSKIVFSGEKLGGGAYAMDTDSEGNIAYVAVYKNFGDVPLMKVDLETLKAEALDKIKDAEGSVCFNTSDKKLYVGDRSESTATIYIYDGKKVTQMKNQAKDALPIYNITFIQK